MQASEIDEEGGVGAGGDEELDELDEEDEGEEFEGEDEVNNNIISNGRYIY